MDEESHRQPLSLAEPFIEKKDTYMRTKSSRSEIQEIVRVVYHLEKLLEIFFNRC